MNKIVKAYLKRLTNLSSRNKSLLVASLPSEQFMDLHETDFLLSKSSFEILIQLIQRKARIPLCDMQDPRFDKVNNASKRLRKIARTERFIEEERGARDLYIGYPFVRGKFADGSVVHAPLLFFPVTLRLDREQWCLFGRNDAELMLNRSFALAYAHFNETKVPDEVLEKTFEDFPKDSLEFRTALYEWIKETPFRINFNQRLFEDTLLPFEILKSSDLQSLEKNGELKLYPEMVLGIFPQAGSYLVPDYQFLLHEADHSTLTLPIFPHEMEDVGTKPGEPGALPGIHDKIKEEQLLTPFPVDLSQENVMRLVKQGESVVVQGPPGTGKSQLICNLMADFAAQGKRVLLVCQKRAALDVVHQRLQTIGLGAFTALIHDFRNDRAELYRQLATQIEKVDEYRQDNYSLDTVFLDREFTKESRLIDQVVTELEEFRKALFDETECGLSVKELYLTCDPQAPKVDFGPNYRYFRLDGSDDYRRRLKSYATYARGIGENHSWYHRSVFASYSLRDLKRMESVLREWPDFFDQYKESFEAVTHSAFDLGFVSDCTDIAGRIEDVIELINDDDTFLLLQRYCRSAVAGAERLAFLRQIVETMKGWQSDGVGVESTRSTADLPMFRAQLAKAMEAKNSYLSGQWWDWFGKENRVIKATGKANGLTTGWEDLKQLEARLAKRIELETWLENPILEFIPTETDATLPLLERYLSYFQKCEKAADAYLRISKKPWKSVLTSLASDCTNFAECIEKLKSLREGLAQWQDKEDELTSFLVETQWQRILDEPTKFSQQLRTELSRDFDSLVEMDTTMVGFSAVEQVVTKLVMAEASMDVDVLSLFENSLRLAWIEHIELKYPTLRAVSSLKMQEWEAQLQKGILRKQDLSKDITLMKLREFTYRDVENNRLGNRVTYRELYHQVTKKRKIWPIRKVIEESSDEVFSLIPCWMASPEAVSTLFPMQKGMFDVVIFDEASQCYAEYTLPAIYRAKQVVVTGDSKQLPPSDLYRIRFEESQEDEEITPVALEIDSLLDLSAQTLASRQLTGHYRSSSLDLIDFSNRYFYKNTLQLLPDFKGINEAEPGIKYLHIQGIWEKNTNQIEAERVVELVKELSDESMTIGIVTFNFQQQQLIQDLLETKSISAKDLFVKNIENVQGDERDVIIFSMGYAPDARGRLVMQFGTLNQQGGENRLNVAITRARNCIYVVTSLWPHQLQTEQSANEGPKLLKAYLHYALEVSDGKYKPELVLNKSYRSEWMLKDKIADEHDSVNKELPFADLTVKQDGKYEGLILTDDDMFFGSLSAKEPHAFLPMLLRTKNWPFQRVYSREYWRREGDVLS